MAKDLMSLQEKKFTDYPGIKSVTSPAKTYYNHSITVTLPFNKKKKKNTNNSNKIEVNN